MSKLLPKTPMMMKNTRMDEAMPRLQINTVKFAWTGKKERQHGRVKNLIYRSVLHTEDNPRQLQISLNTLKKRPYRHIFHLDLSLLSIWKERKLIFQSLISGLKKFQHLSSLTIKIDFCLDLPLIKQLFTHLQRLKYLKRINIDLSKFYEVPQSFLNHLAQVICSFKQVEFIGIALRKTPEMSFNENLVLLLHPLRNLPHLKDLSFFYQESLNMRKIPIKPDPIEISTTIKNLPASISSLSFNIRSNRLRNGFLSPFFLAVARKDTIQKISFDFIDIENILYVPETCKLLQELESQSSIEYVSLNNTLQHASENDIQNLNAHLLKFLNSHPHLKQLDIKFTVPSFFAGIKLASSFCSLKELKSLSLSLFNSNDLIFLQELEKIHSLEYLSIKLEFLLDTLITGFLESLGRITGLKRFTFVFSKPVPKEFFPKEDFKTLFQSLQLLDRLQELTLSFSHSKQDCPLGVHECILACEYLKKAASLEKVHFHGSWQFIQFYDIASLGSTFFRNQPIRMTGEEHFI